VINVLLLDTETTGTELTDVCIEVAAVVYSVTHAAPVRSFASLIRADNNPAEHVNGIPAAMLALAPPAELVWRVVRRMALECDAIVAHNAAFDVRFVPAEVTNGMPWICSCYDLAWPKAPKLGAPLISLCLAHGLGVSHAHRALSDCDLLSRLLTRVHEMGCDLEALLARGLRPKATFQGLVPMSRNNELKEAWFKWKPDTKQWLRTMAIEDAALLPFPTREVTS
jgi:DNA polymerase III epsilon subunit-like protein